MDSEQLAFMRDSLDTYLQRCARHTAPNQQALCSLGLELVEAYEDAIIDWFEQVPDKAARHLSHARDAAGLNKSPVVARELDAAMAVVERFQAEKGRGRHKPPLLSGKRIS